MIISPNMGLLAAGVATGIFLYIGLRLRKNTKAKETRRTDVDDGRCACCLAPFRLSRSVHCSDCGGRICRKVCSRWNISDTAWLCIFCHQQRFPPSCMKRSKKWFENFGGVANEEEKELDNIFGTAKSQVYIEGHETPTTNTEKTQEQENKRMTYAIKIFVEKIIEDIIIDNVDDMPIEHLYKDPEYDKFLKDYCPLLIVALTRLVTSLDASLMNKPSSDPPAMAHVALREIIERAAAEAQKLPGLSASVNIEHSREHPIAKHSYEDLLATAILNKVIEKCQREQHVDGNSNVLCDTDSPKTKCTTTEHGFEEEATSYESCHIECSNDNGESTARKNKDDRDLMSFMIEERIEEVTTITSDDKLRDNNKFRCTRCVPFPEFGMDIVDPPRNSPSPSSSSESLDDYPRIKRRVADHTMDFALSVESWEDNWLFQKKRISESQPDPVVMLVPSSSADYKALIGDRDAEDTSDLSECSSTKSDEEIEKELLEAINNVIPRTPKTSECDAEVNQEVPSIKTQLEKEVVTCHTNTNIEKIEIVCDKRKKDDKDKTLEVLEEKTVKDEENERKRSEGSSLITTVKEEKAKEKFKNTECDTKPIEIKSSVNNVKKLDFENLSEKNDQVENITEENEEQRESEYTEHYDTAIQRHLDSLTKVDVCSEKSETFDKTKQIAYTQHGKPENNFTVEKSEYSKAQIQLSYATIEGNHMTAENDRLSAPPRPGTIAEREHKKWENAPPIENNPYSEESIRKRCLERQYSKNSDIPSVQYKLTKLNEVNLNALLPERSDIKRFERDYYINQSKSASKKQEEWAKLATSSVSSRPNSSLSQWSSDEQQHERQDKPASKEIDSVSILQEDRNVTMTALWRKNNTEVISPETNNRALVVNLQKNKNEKNDETTTWKNHYQRTDDILENQRKNSKNKINAKLNNQEHISEHKDDEKRKIRRIDLKTYGFEEISDQRKKTARHQRVVNKLDLSSYGYENGVLRRARSNIQLHRPLQNEKSNLTKWTIECIRGEYKEYAPKSLDCKKFTNSKDFTKLKNGHRPGLRLISTKSMPNVADDVYYKSSLIYENRVARNLIDRAIDRSEDELMDECSMIDNSSLLNSYDEISSDINKSFEDIYVKSKDHTQLRRQVSEEFQMLLSVKKLAEAFDQKQTSKVETIMPAKVNRISVMKTDNAKERSPISEVQVVEKPRQMHSLTARSLSREFREGLRQIPSKVISPPVSRSVTEERSANRAEVVRSKQEDKDTNVISPGKLRSNIIFWEQLQKKS